MKLSIDKSILIGALQMIAPVTDRSSSKPILSNFLLTASGDGANGKVVLSATDYELSMRGEFPAKVSEPGSVCISAKKVLDVCREFLSEEVEIASDPQLWVNFRGGPSRLRLPSVENGLYPTMEWPELAHGFSLAGQALRRCIDLTLFATLASETRKNLMGVCLKLGREEVQWVATDGHRLAKVQRAVQEGSTGEAPEIIVPRKALAEMQRMLERSTEAVRLSFDERNLRLDAGKVMLMTRLIEGKFPNVDPVIPKDSDKAVLVNRERLINALRIVSHMSAEKIKPVKISIGDGMLRVESERAEYGDSADEFAVDYEGEEVKIGFNARYLLDVLAVADAGDEVRLQLKGALNPCLVEMPDEAGFLSVVMPLRLEW